jgi:SNF2 family DNA or RNA helicase
MSTKYHFVKEIDIFLFFLSSIKSTHKHTTMSIELYDFQQTGVEKLYENEKSGYGSILAFDMGLGKTLTMSFFLIQQRNIEFPEYPDLIVVPLCVLTQWEKEIQRLNNNMKIHIYHGSNRVSNSHQICKSDFVITTYHSLATRELESYNWNRIILDEAHTIRNGIGSKYQNIPKRALGAFALIKNSKYRHCITGTPYNNNENDILSLMKFIGIPDNNILSFIDKYVIQKTKENLMNPISIETIMIDSPPLEKISEYHNYVSLYKKLSYLLKIRTNPIEARSIYRNLLLILTKLRLYCDIMMMNKKDKIQFEKEKEFEEEEFEKKEFEKEKEEFEEEIEEEFEKEKEFEKENKIQNQEKFEEINFYENSIKIKTVYDKMVDIIHTVPYKRIIIFSSFVMTLEILDKLVEEKNPEISTYKYIGKKNRNEREKIVEEFTKKDDTQPMILFASLGAGSCGLNLTPCSTIFLVDISMNPFDQLQAINRVHRITQTKQVNVFKFCMKNMIEETILIGNDRKISEAKTNGLLIL